jgi:hypothetical protein
MGKKSDGVIGCDEQQTTVNQFYWLRLGSCEYCVFHDKMIYKMKN